MKNVFSRKTLVILIAIVILLATAFALAYQKYRSSTQEYRSPIGFAYYEPSYLPPNVSVKEKKLVITEADNVQVEQAFLGFASKAGSYSILEYKTNDPLGSANQNYDETSVKPTCSIVRSPRQIAYRLCHWVDDGKVSVREIKFIKGSTFVYARVPTSLDEHISFDEINRFVDSFERKSTQGMPVEHHDSFV